MPLADFQILMLPFLESLKAGEERTMNDIKADLIRFIELTDGALKPFDITQDESEFQEAFLLAKQHLTKAGLIESAGIDRVRITSFGTLVLGKRLNSMDIKYLRNLPGYSD